MAYPRDNSSQMDFDYDNKVGPASNNSAFAQAIQRNQQSSAGQQDAMSKKRESRPSRIKICRSNFAESDIPKRDQSPSSQLFGGSFSPDTFTFGDCGPSEPHHGRGVNTQAVDWNGDYAKRNVCYTGPYSDFASPTKSSTAFGNLRSPSGASLFSQPTQASQNTAFTTPRVSREAEIPSSGPETSPDNNADSEATPDTSRALIKRKWTASMRDVFTQLIQTLAVNPLKPYTSGRNYNGGQHSPLFKHSSGRGEIRHHITKRRRKDSDKERHKLHQKATVAFHASSDSEDDSKQTPKSHTRSHSPQQPSHPPPGILSTFFDYIHDRPFLPAILARYAQLTFNFGLLVGFFAAIAYGCFNIYSDINKKSSQARAKVLAQIAFCSKSFQENHCEDLATHTLAPALHQPCMEWTDCMNQDVNISIGKSRLSARLFAEMCNDFIEPISWKAFAFAMVFLLVVILGFNVMFFFFRAKMAVAPMQSQQPPQPPQHPGAIYPAPGYGYGYGNQQAWNEQGMYAGQYTPRTPSRGMHPPPQPRYLDGTPAREDWGYGDRTPM
ncbi:MAG: hypothetical protein Q9162_007183 [Coniocarpon cinnabarinum]